MCLVEAIGHLASSDFSDLFIALAQFLFIHLFRAFALRESRRGWGGWGRLCSVQPHVSSLSGEKDVAR